MSKPASPIAVLDTAREEPLVLVRRVGTSTWLARQDGELVVARPAPDGPLAHLSELVRLDIPQAVRLRGVCERDGATWLVSDQVDGLSLQRLLTVTSFTPVQAAYLAVQTMAALEALHAEGRGHGRFGPENVLVGLDGEPRITDWAVSTLTGARDLGEMRAADRDACQRLVGDLARNADRPVVRRTGRFDLLLAALSTAGRRDELADLAPARKKLRAELLRAAGADAGLARAQSHLAALVATLAAPASETEIKAPSLKIPVIKDGPSWDSPVHVPPPLPPGRLTTADWQRPPKRPLWHIPAGILGVLLLAGLVVLAAKPIGDLADRVLNRHEKITASAPPTAAAKPSGPPSASVPARPTAKPPPVLAPAAAGVITGVELRPLAACRAGAPCTIRATVRVAQPPEAVPVRWHYAVVDRCTGKRTDAPGGGIVAQAGWDYVYEATAVPLPRAKSLAVIAVTDTPMAAASAPLLIPAGNPVC